MREGGVGGFREVHTQSGQLSGLARKMQIACNQRVFRLIIMRIFRRGAHGTCQVLSGQARYSACV